MRVLIDIQDSESDFALRVLQSLSFIEETTVVSDSALALWQNLNQAAKEVKSHKLGETDLQTADELLNEL